MFSYVAYGLEIESELLLPEMAAGSGKADVMIRRGTLEHPQPRTDSPVYCFWSTSQGMHLFWSEVGTLLIRGGSEIVVDAVTGVEERRLRLLLLGAAMGVVLHQRGLPVFHASAVTANETAIAFLGGRGWGKSTIAAALHMRGHRVITDDVMALDLSGTNGPVAFPAFPQLKLWPDAVTALGEDPEALSALSSRFEKRERLVTSGFAERPTPLKRIYVLATGPAPEIEPLQPQEAMTELLRNFYVGRFGKELMRPGEATYFLQCAEVARSVPVYRLKRPSSLVLLPAVAQLVREHILENGRLYDHE